MRTTQSNINKHIKKMNSKPDKERKNHSKIETQVFIEIARQHEFRTIASTEKLRKENETARKKK
jgi:hypothetical protein